MVRGRPRHPDVLTPAEWSVVEAVRHGMSTRVIAQRRGISEDAVKFHVRNVLAKLGLPDRTALRNWDGITRDSALHPHPAAGDRARERSEAAMTLTLGPIGQVARPVSDIDQAVHWYGSVLGLTHLYTFGDLAFFDCAGVRLFLSAGEGGRGEPSVLYFRVDDIHAAREELIARGVQFTDAPHMIFRHDSGVEEWMAFFADPDGHPLALMSAVEPRSDGS